MATSVVLSSDGDVWELLKKIGTAKVQPENVELSFDNFPHIALKFEGPKFDAALPARCLDSLKGFQDEIYRMYALTVYNDESYVLSPAEKDDLEIFFKIDPGSSFLKDLNLDKILNKIVESAIGKMEPKHYVIIVSVLAASYASFEIARKYQEGQIEISKQVVEVEKTKAAAEVEIRRQKEETRRMEILRDAIQKAPEAKKAVQSTDRCYEQVAKSIKGTEKVVMPDKTVVTEKTAKEYYPRAARRKAEEVRLDGQYYIKSVDHHSEDFKIRVQNGKGQEFVATLNALNKDSLKNILEALAESTLVELEINAKNLEGEIRDLAIVKAISPRVALDLQN